MADKKNATTNDQFTVTGLFKDKESAECAYNALSSRGYSKDDVDVVMSNETRDRYYPGDTADDTELGSKALEGTGTGAAVGGTVGAVLAAIAAIGTSVVLPGIGLIVAGPLAAALVGAGAGGLAGGLIGALVGSGIPEEHAREYETGVKSGGIVLRATPRNAEDAAYLEREWGACGGEQIYSNAPQRTTTAARNPNATGRSTNEVAVPVIEEELQVSKRAVQTGGVRVESRVTERPVEETVRLREEHVNVERRPVNRPVNEADLGKFQEGVIEVTETAEVPIVAKEARVTEEVVIGKEVGERTETVRDTVRRADVEIEQLSPEGRKGKGGSRGGAAAS